MKKTILFIGGWVCLLAGIILILAWWPSVVALFQGTIGIVLALAGILLLYMARI